jgi:hypothetical protein
MGPEAKVEQFLVQQVSKYGGRALKWCSPSNVGVPDRIVFLNKQIWFVEVKSLTGRLSTMQKVWFDWADKFGLNYKVVRNKLDVVNLMKEILGDLYPS